MTTTSLWHRRRVERLAQLLEEVDAPRRHRVPSPSDEELTGLVAVRNQLFGLAPPEIDPEFRSGLRAMLVATAEREGSLAPEPARPEPAALSRTGRQRSLARGPRARTAVITGVTVGAVAFAGMSTASANALPGDALYGVKRSTEWAQLALASSDVGRAQLYFSFAQTRLAEASTVTDGLDRVLDDMDRDTTAGISLLTTAATNRSDPEALDPIGPFVTTQRRALADLEGQVDDADLARVDSSRELLDAITQRATDLRRDLELGCQPATSIDALGPQPERCFTLPVPSTLGSSGQVPTQPQPEQVDPPEEVPEAPPDRSLISPDGGGQASGGSADGEGPAAPPAADEEPAVGAEGTDSEADGGLLNGLNRLLGDLLGG